MNIKSKRLRRERDDFICSTAGKRSWVDFDWPQASHLWCDQGAVLQVNCALGEVPVEHPVEGVQLAIEGNGREFSEPLSGHVMFLAMRPEVSTAAKAPQQEKTASRQKRSSSPSQRGPKRSGELLTLAKRCNNVKRTKNPERISAGSNFRERPYQAMAKMRSRIRIEEDKAYGSGSF